MGQIQATISLYTLDKYAQALGGDSIFSLLQLPAGINKETVTNNILLESMDFEAVYTDPDFLRDAIYIWGKTNYHTFEKWYTAQQIEYDPLNNYDRHEEWTDKGTDKKTTSGTQSDTANLTVNEGTTSEDHRNSEEQTSENGRQEHYVAPYDTNQLTQDIQVQDEGSSSRSGSENGNGSTTRTATQQTNGNTTTSGNENGTTTGEHSGHLWGNIGVTTSQQMLQAEYDIAEWNLVQHITDMFMQKFCIMVY